MKPDEILLKEINGQVFFDEPMVNHTTFHIGGPADILVIPEKIEDIKYCISYSKKNHIPFYLIGNGSKLLVSDTGIRGIVIKLGQNMGDVKFSGETIIAGAGIFLSKLMKIASQNNLSGIEFASGIPGTLGGAVVMNAGTHLGKMSDVIERVTVLNSSTLEQTILSKNECSFGYRDSIFQAKNSAILEVEIKLKRSENEQIQNTINKFLKKRQKTQPWGNDCAGSIFKNPPEISAGKLLDNLGLKGYRKGNAKISEIHANFIINLGDAKASDVYFLIKLARDRAKKTFNIVLEPEIICLGDFE